MKSDALIRSDVVAELNFDPAITATDVGVHSWAERRAAQGAARSAPGVASVVNHLRVEA